MEKKSWLKIIIINLVIALSLVTIAEIIIRVVAARSNVFNINIGAAMDFHPTRGTQLKANYKAEGISINSFRILGPEIELKPNPSGIRILTIGDSTSFHPQSRNYSRVLEDKLKEYFPGHNIEVIVGAVPGYNSYKALDWYKEFLYKLNPDITIIYIGWNDILSIHPFNKTELLRQNIKARSFLQKLYVVRLPYYFMREYERKKATDLSPLSAEERNTINHFYPYHYSNNLKIMIEKLKNQGSLVYLITLPGLITYNPTNDELKRMYYGVGMNNKFALYKAVYNKYHKVLEEVAASTNTPTIDLREIIKSPEQREIFTDTMHFNMAGSEVFGNYIANYLKADLNKMIVRKRSHISIP
ncbi:MAG: GDSL-type esterase/lipase family protein [Bacteroidales bacterium]